MTGLVILQRALKRLDEDSSSPVYYSGGEVLAAINEGQRLFALLTLCLETTGTLALTAATSHYRMLGTFTDWLLPLRVRIQGTGGQKLDYARLADLDALNPAWQDEAGAPERYAALGFDFFSIHPRPAGTGTSLEVTYARCPTKMTSTSQTPETPEEHHPALVDYVIPCLRAKEGGQEFLNSLKYLDRFLESADKYAQYIRARNLGQNYDRGPFEMKSFDRSRLIGAMKGKGTKNGR